MKEILSKNWWPLGMQVITTEGRKKLKGKIHFCVIFPTIPAPPFDPLYRGSDYKLFTQNFKSFRQEKN